MKSMMRNKSNHEQSEVLSMNDFMMNLMEKYLEKYGEAEQICSSSVLKGNWVANTSYDTVHVDKTDDLLLRDALVGQGRILEEDLDNHVYVDLIRVGKRDMSEALLVVKREDRVVHIAAYAKEGLIKQHLSKQAVEKAKLFIEKQSK